MAVTAFSHFSSFQTTELCALCTALQLEHSLEGVDVKQLGGAVWESNDFLLLVSFKQILMEMTEVSVHAT